SLFGSTRAMPRRRPRRAATRRPGGSDLPRALTRAGLRPGALQPSTWSTWQIRGAILIFRRWEAMKWAVEATRYVVIDDGAYVYPVLRDDLGPDDTPDALAEMSPDEYEDWCERVPADERYAA